MDRDDKNNICEDIYSGFNSDALKPGKIDPVVFPKGYPVIYKRVSEADAMEAAHDISKMLRKEKMATAHNPDDWIIMVERIKEMLYEKFRDV